MSRFRLGSILVAAAIVVIALSGVAASSASAVVFTLSTEECTGGTFINMCWNSAGLLLELVGEQTVTIAKTTGSGNAVFTGVIGSEVFTIECEAIKQGAEDPPVIKQLKPLSENGKMLISFIFEKCKLTAPAALAKKCIVPVSKETLDLEGTFTSVSEIDLIPTAGETAPFIQLTFSNNGTEVCPATFKTGEHAVTGLQAVTILNPEVHETTKKGTAVVKSGLKLAGSAAELSAAVTLSFPGLEDEVDIVKTS